MEIDIRRPKVREDELGVEVNGSGLRQGSKPYAGIVLADDRAYLHMDSPADCDRLIRAAVEAKQKLLAAVVPHTFREGEKVHYECRECGVHEGHHIDAPESDKLHAEPATVTVPWPTGLCGHTVTPGAWSQGYATCRGCLPDWDRREAQALYDRATAGEQLPQAAS